MEFVHGLFRVTPRAMVRPRFTFHPIPTTLSAALEVLAAAHVRNDGGRRSIPIAPPQIANREAYAAAWRIVCNEILVDEHERNGRLIVDTRNDQTDAIQEVLAICRNDRIARAAFEAACRERPGATVRLRAGIRVLATRSPKTDPSR